MVNTHQDKSNLEIGPLNRTLFVIGGTLSLISFVDKFMMELSMVMSVVKKYFCKSNIVEGQVK